MSVYINSFFLPPPNFSLVFNIFSCYDFMIKGDLIWVLEKRMQNNFSTTKWMLMLEASICVSVCMYVSVTIISHSNPARPLTSFLAQRLPRYSVVTYCVIDLEDHSRLCMFIKEHGIPNIANWTKILSLLWGTKMSWGGGVI